ncbi:MAG: DUF5716 family protein [Lachnospiraceae bacterium]|nr:DUF5716 family protein [Lachnospiraceae bacterium]
MAQKKKLFTGIDLNQERAMITFFHEDMKEMETVSTVPEEERCQIPTAVFCTGQGNYFYGDEAIRRENRTDGTFFSQLYIRSLDPENVAYRNMLVQFLRRLLQFKGQYVKEDTELCLSIAIPAVTDEAVGLFSYVRKELDVPEQNFRLMDYTESFFAYVYHQESSVCLHDVALFDFHADRITASILHSDGYGSVKRVTSVQKEWTVPEYLLAHGDGKDEFFANVVRETFTKRILSGVFLIGDGFDGDWMRESLRVIGPNKRVFKGKNIYTMGACYAGYRSFVTEGWNYYYDSPYKLQGELSLKIMKGTEPCFLRLTRLGENWFAPTEAYYFLYDGDPTLETWIRVRQRMSARIERFTLDYLPDRAPNSIRLGVQALPTGGSEVVLRVWDDGFGELYESTGKVWEFRLSL